MNESQEVIVQLGSNQGDRKRNLHYAIQELETFSFEQTYGSIYVSEAWGLENQADFYNQIVSFHTVESVFQTFERIQHIENKMGRLRTLKWGPRIIDIDILFFGQKIIQTRELIVPHPRMSQRRFVMLPLQENWTQYRHPKLNQRLHEIYSSCNDHLEVSKLN